ncbi:MAG: hypothetical protein AAF318_12740 [Pseudomonadota bacterium]
MPRKNRFEMVDDIQADAITLELAPDGDAEMGRVHVPGALRPAGDAPVDIPTQVTAPLAKKDAFRGAIQLANQIKAPVVVMGDKAHWDDAWGDLYRPV